MVMLPKLLLLPLLLLLLWLPLLLLLRLLLLRLLLLLLLLLLLVVGIVVAVAAVAAHVNAAPHPLSLPRPAPPPPPPPPAAGRTTNMIIGVANMDRKTMHCHRDDEYASSADGDSLAVVVVVAGLAVRDILVNWALVQGEKKGKTLFCCPARSRTLPAPAQGEGI